MERAGTGERIAGVVMWDEDVAELGMHEPVDGSAIEDDAGTDARAHRHVDEVRQPPSGAPALLGKRCRVHIGVEGNGDVELLAERADDVGVVPTRFRGLCDPAERLRSDAHIDGPKEPTPRAATRTLSRLKNSTTRPSVSGGVVVGMTSTSVRSPGPVPLAHTHFVPPASTPPKTAGSDAAGAQSGSRGSVSVLVALAGVWIAGTST